MSARNNRFRRLPATAPRRSGRHRAVSEDARRHRLARGGGGIVRPLEGAGVHAAIAPAVTVLVNPEAVGSQSLSPNRVHQLSDPRNNPTVQVAADVLPSVVSLQLDQGGRPVIRSGVVLAADGLIMTNNHVLT